MDLIEQLRRDEGVRYTLYKDSVGIDTFGTGFTFPIDDAENDFILQHRVDKISAALADYSWFSSLDAVRQAALINMGYNLGVSGLLHFPTMIHCLSIQDWPGASAAALNSVWAKQVGARAERVAQQIATGVWIS
jgi:lysozyme